MSRHFKFCSVVGSFAWSCASYMSKHFSVCLVITAKLHTYQCSCNVYMYLAVYSIGHWLSAHIFYVTHQYCAIDKPALMQRFSIYSLYQTQPHTWNCDESKKAVAALPQEEFAHYCPPREFRNFSVKPRWRTVVKSIGKTSENLHFASKWY